MRSLASPALLLCVLSLASIARGQTLGVVVTGAPTAQASRLALRVAELLDADEDLTVVESQALRRALAGVPAAGEGEDALAEVRRLAAAATGERARSSLSRLGQRLEVDLLVTVGRAGEEAELRAFDVARGAFYRGSLMVPIRGALDRERLVGFVGVRASAAVGETGRAEEAPQPRERQSRWGQWWVWAIVGAAVIAVAAVAYFAYPGGGTEQDVRLRLVAPQ